MSLGYLQFIDFNRDFFNEIIRELVYWYNCKNHVEKVICQDDTEYSTKGFAGNTQYL